MGNRWASENVAGSYRFFEFNVSGVVKLDPPNVLAVEVFPPQPDDLAITWVDVNPMPADKDMGLWQGVYLTSSGPVSMRYPQVVSHLDCPRSKQGPPYGHGPASQRTTGAPSRGS